MHHLTAILQIFGIVYLRFRLLPRLWCVWLVGVNAACLLFIDHPEAQVVLGVTLLAVVLQSVIYQRTGFTRLLGIVHITWIPMFGWMVSRMEVISETPDLLSWISVLFVTNLVSLLIDSVDVARYVNGERAPHYVWTRTAEVTR